MPIEHGELSVTRSCDGANLNNTLLKCVTRSVNRTRIKRATEIESINIVYETWTNISEQPGWMCVVYGTHGSSNTNIKTFNVFNILNSIKWLIGTIYFMKRKKKWKIPTKKKAVHATPLIQCVHAWVNAFANLQVTYQICNCWMLQGLKWLASVQ